MAIDPTAVQAICDGYGYQWSQYKALATGTNGANIAAAATGQASRVHALADIPATIALLASAEGGAVARATPGQDATIFAAELRALNAHLGGINAYLVGHPTLKATTNFAEVCALNGIAIAAGQIDAARPDAA